MFTEYGFHLVVDVCSLFKTPRPILQLVPGVALELIEFCEYCYHRDFENWDRLISVHEVAIRHAILIWAESTDIAKKLDF
jgi:hypothetical protein